MEEVEDQARTNPARARKRNARPAPTDLVRREAVARGRRGARGKLKVRLVEVDQIARAAPGEKLEPEVADSQGVPDAADWRNEIAEDPRQ